MSRSHDPFDRLLRLSRRIAETHAPDEMPPALPTRVFARLRSKPGAPVSALEWLSLRAVPLAALAAAGCVYFGGGFTWGAPTDERAFAQVMIEQQLAP